jgi:transmembrane sensor
LAIATFAFTLIGGGLLGWNHWRQLPTFEQAYATARGQRLTINLPDAGQRKGTIVQLDTSSHADARLYRDRREVLLKDGQAMLTVASDASKPFQVRAGALRITVVGTRFSVRHTASGLDAGQTVVSVEEGHVRVERASQASGNDLVNLTAGQQVVADAMGRIGPVQRIPVTAIALWRSGRISFEQTPLAQAVAEFERYGHTGLLVRDPAVAALPIGGSYNLQQFQQFVETLPQVLPVKLVPQGNVMEVVAR